MAERDIGKFIKLALVRALREDRTTIAAIEFIEFMLGPEFTKPVTDRVE